MTGTQKINDSSFIINMKDVLIKSSYYGESIELRNNHAYNYIYLDVGQFFHFKLHKVIIDNNIIAFENSKNVVTKEYLRFDKVYILPFQSSQSDNNIIFNIEIQLNDKIILQRRKYKQLFDKL